MDEKKIKALLIEDNPDDIRLLQEMLRWVGAVQIEMVNDDRLSTGLERLAEKGFDVLLLDLGLPDSGGLDTLRKTHTRAPWIPIVVLSGFADESVSVEAVKEGAQDYLVKGQFDNVLLVRTIRYAIERKQAEKALRESEETAKRLAYENAIMVEIDRIISSTLEIGEVCERFSEEVSKVIPFDRIAISTINPEKTSLAIAYDTGIKIACHDQEDVFPSTGSATELILNIQAGIIVEAESKEELAKRFPGLLPSFEAGLRSTMAVPLISKGKMIGGLTFHSVKPNTYTKENLELAEKLGHQIAGAIANAQLFSERKRAEEELRKSEEAARRVAQENAIMAEIGRIISSNLNFEEVYEGFAGQVGKLIPFDRLAITTIRPEKRTFNVAYVTGLEVPGRDQGHAISLTRSVIEEALCKRSGILVHMNNEREVVHRYPDLLPSLRAGLRTMIAAPLISKDQVIGTLSLFSRRPDIYKEEDLRRAVRVGNQISGAIANAQLFMEHKQAEEHIREALAEKEVLLKEIHHRVKNNLQVISSLLKLHSQYIKEEQDRQVLKECQNHVKSMALVHEKLYRSRDLAEIDFADYVHDLVAHLFRSYQASLGNVVLKVNVDKISFSIDLAVPLGLLVNELVSNCFKHAFPDRRDGEIQVDLHSDGGGLCVLSVSDNGAGYPEDLDFRNTETLGLQLVNTLVDQIEGTIEHHRLGGTKLTITFTEEHKSAARRLPAAP